MIAIITVLFAGWAWKEYNNLQQSVNTLDPAFGVVQTPSFEIPVLRKTVDFEKLQKRKVGFKTKYYLPNKQTPFTGKALNRSYVPYLDWGFGATGAYWIHEWYNLKEGVFHGEYKNQTKPPDGQVTELGNYKNGRRDGLWTKWATNGEEQDRTTYKDGRKVKD